LGDAVEDPFAPSSDLPECESAGADDPGSDFVDVARLSARFLVPSDEEAGIVRETIGEVGLLAVRAVDAQHIVSGRPSPIVVIHMAAADSVSALNSLSCRSQAIAVCASESEELEALRAGAVATIRSPVCAEVLTLHLRRLQQAVDSANTWRDAAERDAAVARAETVQHVVSGLTHEICSPLSVVEVDVDLLRERLEQCRAGQAVDWDELQTIVSECSAAIHRMSRTVQEVQRLSRPTGYELQKVSLPEVVEEAVLNTPNPQAVPIDQVIVTEQVALARRELVVHVVSNLIANALHAVRSVPQPKVTVRVYGIAGEARISIRDNGPGVPEPLRERIFEPFFTTKGSEGTGVGLALCRELVARMRGALTLAQGASGACFRVRLRPATSIHPH
jgi:signal transduction histidine kinase